MLPASRFEETLLLEQKDHNSDCIDTREPVLLNFEEPEEWRNRMQDKEQSIIKIMINARER